MADVTGPTPDTQCRRCEGLFPAKYMGTFYAPSSAPTVAYARFCRGCCDEIYDWIDGLISEGDADVVEIGRLADDLRDLVEHDAPLVDVLAKVRAIRDAVT